MELELEVEAVFNVLSSSRVLVHSGAVGKSKPAAQRGMIISDTGNSNGFTLRREPD